MVAVMSDRTFPVDAFPMAVKVRVLHVLYFIMSCAISLCLVNISKIIHVFI